MPLLPSMTNPLAEEFERAAGPERTLLINDAARLMGVSRRTVYYRIQEGRLTTMRTVGGSTRVVIGSLQELIILGQRKNASRGRLREPSPPPRSEPQS